MPSPFILQYVQQLMADAGLDALDAQFREEYAEKLSAQVEERLGLKAVGMLDENGKKEYLLFLEKHGDGEPSPDEMVNFFAAHIPDFSDKMKVVLQEFSQEFLTSIKSG